MALQVNIHEAKTQLSKIIARACRGEEIVIAKAGRPLVRLTPIEQRPSGRRFGALRGKARKTVVCPRFRSPGFGQWSVPGFGQAALSPVSCARFRVPGFECRDWRGFTADERRSSLPFSRD